MNAHAEIAVVAAVGATGDRVAPRLPNRISELGLDEGFLVDLLVKTVFRLGFERASEIGWAMRLQAKVANELVSLALEMELLEPVLQLGADPSAAMCYVLSDRGSARAREALDRSAYHGPVPVALEDFARQAEKQSIRNETLTPAALNKALVSLTLPRTVLDELGPAANSAAAILLYGPSGNGKSSIARAISSAFGGTVYIPHALVVDKQVITIFDPAVHSPREGEKDLACAYAAHALVPPHDLRFVACRRPALIAGAELTLDRLDPTLNTDNGIYDAPIHVKAAGGILVIDDLGGQSLCPQALINRLIMPLERGRDELALHTGRRFGVPFDALVVFTTNMRPSQLAENAALRRLRHKVLVERPEPDTYVKLFNRTARELGFKANNGITAYLLDELYGRTEGAELEAFHPRFLLEHVSSIASFKGSARRLSREFLRRAWENLYPVEKTAVRTPPAATVVGRPRFEGFTVGQPGKAAAEGN